MNFWDFIWWMLWIYILFAFLMMLFSIFADLFRDKDLNGWAKALWVVFIIFLPLLGVLVYLIARGRGMAERGIKQAAAAQRQTDDYIKDAAGTSPSAEIAKASELLAQGSITQAEFDALKVKALA